MKIYLLTRLTPFLLLGMLLACSPDTPTEGEAGIEADVAAETISLEDSAWQLVKIQSIGDYVFTPEDPSLYTFRFRMENRLVIKSDCNTAGATWVQDDRQLMLEQFVTTRSMCAPGSLHNRLVSQLISTQSFEIRDGHLFLFNMTPDTYLELEPSQ